MAGGKRAHARGRAPRGGTRRRGWPIVGGAPAGAGLAFVPVYLWLSSGNDLFREWYVVMPWALGVAMLMISAIPTYSWSSIRLRRSWRLFALAGVGLLGAALVTAPWQTLLAVCAVYVTLLPFGVASYARIRRRG